MTTVNGGLLLAIIGIASAVVFLAGVFRCDRADFRFDANDWGRGSGDGDSGCGGSEAYALCAGLISMLLVVGLLVARRPSSSAAAAGSATPALGAFLLLWWLVAALVLTFHGPFYAVGNGYIGVWAACFASFAFAHEVSATVQKVSAPVIGGARAMNRHVLVVVAGSTVELVAAALGCRSGCAGYSAYAVAVGAASLFLCFLLIILPKTSLKGNRAMLALSVFLFLWWFVGAVILTFISPFTSASNGYWATWASVIAAALIAQTASGHAQPSAGAVGGAGGAA